MLTQVADTSADAFRGVGLERQQALNDMVREAVARAQRRGAASMSMQEIKCEILDWLGRNEELSSISSTVNRLVAARRLVRLPEHRRRCSRSGKTVKAVSIPLTQGVLL